MDKEKSVIELNGKYCFKDYENSLCMSVEMIGDMKKKMTYEEAIMCFANAIIENQQLKEVIDKAKNKSIELQNKYSYILDDLTYLLMTVGDSND